MIESLIEIRLINIRTDFNSISFKTKRVGKMGLWVGGIR